MKFDCLTYSVGHVRNVLISLFISNIQFYYHPGMWGWVYPLIFPGAASRHMGINLAAIPRRRLTPWF